MPSGTELKQAKQKAIRYLGYRDRSVAEMRSYLKRKEFPSEVIEEALAYLLEIRYLDDERFAMQFGRSRMEGKQLGRYRLRNELKLKGVHEEIIDRTLSDLYGEVDERELARQCAEKKMKSWRGLDQQVQKRRMAQFLQRKGFGGDVIFKTVDTLFSS